MKTEIEEIIITKKQTNDTNLNNDLINEKSDISENIDVDNINISSYTDSKL